MLNGEFVLESMLYACLYSYLCGVYVPLVLQVHLPFPAAYCGQLPNILHCNNSRPFPRGAS